MATVTWDGSSSTDYGTAANWDTGSVPTSSDDVIIADVTNNCVLDGSRSVNSFTVESGGDFNGNTEMLTVVGENSSGFAVNIDGVIVGTTTDITITTAAATTLDLYAQGGGKLRHVTINHASCVATLGALLDISGNLTITAGELNTNSGSNYAVTVTGVVTNNGTLTLNGSTVNLGSTSAEAGDFQGSGTFNLDTSTINFHTASSANFTPDTSANFDTNTSTLNLIGLDSSTRAHNFTFASGNLHNVTTSRGTGSGTHIDKLNGNCTITGNLTVGANSKFSSGTRVFTVNGDVSVTGELDCDDSDKPMTFGNLTIASTGTYNATSGTTTILGSSGGFALLDEGTFTHNGGTVKIDFETSNLNSSTRIHQNGAKKLNNVEIEMNRTTDEVTWSVASGTSQGIAGNFTLTKGESYLYSLAHDFDVDGDFLVDANGTWGSLGHSGSHEAKSLTINSGGSYIATSGTTTITSETSSHAWKNEGGTFTHNNGKVKFDLDNSAGSSNVKENEFYDVEVDMFASTYSLSFFDTSGNAVTILNNLDLTKGKMNFSTASDTITIHGLTKVAADGTFSDNAAHDTNKIIHNGLVTNLGTYKINDGTTVKMNGGIRNLGTVTVA